MLRIVQEREREKENRHILPPAITNVTLTLPKQSYLDWHREKHNLSRSGRVSGSLSAVLVGSGVSRNLTLVLYFRCYGP